jgi:hypothetical protein
MSLVEVEVEVEGEVEVEVDTTCLPLFFIAVPPTPVNDDAVDAADDTAVAPDDDDEKIHLLYIVNVGRLNGINLQR